MEVGPEASVSARIVNTIHSCTLSIWKYIVFLFEFLLLPVKVRNNGNSEPGIENNEVKSWSQVPHAKELPFVGTLIDIIRFGGGARLHEYIKMRHNTLGPIFKENLGGRNILFLSDPAFFSDVRKQEGDLPVPLIMPAVELYMKHNKDFPKGLLASDTTELWHKPRLTMNKVLLKKSSEITDAFIGYQKLLKSYMCKWKKLAENNTNEKQGYLPNSYLELLEATFTSLCSVVVGKRYTDHILKTNIDTTATTKIILESFKSQHVMTIINPWIAKTLGLKVWKDFVKKLHESTDISNQLIETGIECLQDDSIPHSLEEDGLLYKIFAEEGTSKSETMRVVNAMINETTLALGTTIQWAIYCVARHPEVQEKIYQEIRAIHPTGDPTLLYDMHNFNYLSWCVRESLRMYPVAPFTARKFKHDYWIGGYHIPTGSYCALSACSTHYNPEYFLEPTRYWPERWEREVGALNLKGVKNVNAFIPFGIGGRACVGRKVGEQIVQLLIAELVLHFKMECEEVTPVLETILTLDKPLALKLTPRDGMFNL